VHAPGQARIGAVVTTLVIGALSLLWLIPLAMLGINAMKTTPEYFRDSSPLVLPANPGVVVRNLADAWANAGIGADLIASLVYGTTGAALGIACAALGAYGIARLNIRGRFFWFALVFSGSLFPIQMYLIPLFRLYLSTGLYDTQLGMILFYAAASIPFGLFVFRTFFATIPRDLQDAARLDAGDWSIFWRIFLPLAKAPMAVVFLFQFTWIWNDLAFGLVLSASDGVRPVTAGLAGMQSLYSTTGPPTLLAGAIIGTLPTLVLFLFLSRYMLTGLVLTTGTQAARD